VTISTIGIGGAFINTTFLTFLAHATGGTFYQMRTLEELPQLIARDTQDTMGRLPFAEGYFRPVTSPASEWFAPADPSTPPSTSSGLAHLVPSTALGATSSRGDSARGRQDSAPEALPLGLRAWPILRGYWTATAKPGALVEVTVNGGEGDEPLFARWTVGRGRVAAFTSDADARWSPEWIRWELFDATWAKVVRWAMRPRLSEELFIRVDERPFDSPRTFGFAKRNHGGRSGFRPTGEEGGATGSARGAPRRPTRLIMEGFLRHPQVTVVRSDPAGQGAETPRTLPVIQSGPWRWDASLAQVPSGWHQVTIESGEGFAARWIHVGEPVSAEEERTGLSPHEDALRRIAAETGCAYDEPEQAFLPPMTTTVTHEPAWLWWLPFVVLLLLVDVALRGPSLLQ
jgi:hypothetical protein